MFQKLLFKQLKSIDSVVNLIGLAIVKLNDLMVEKVGELADVKTEIEDLKVKESDIEREVETISEISRKLYNLI